MPCDCLQAPPCSLGDQQDDPPELSKSAPAQRIRVPPEAVVTWNLLLEALESNRLVMQKQFLQQHEEVRKDIEESRRCLEAHIVDIQQRSSVMKRPLPPAVAAFKKSSKEVEAQSSTGLTFQSEAKSESIAEHFGLAGKIARTPQPRSLASNYFSDTPSRDGNQSADGQTTIPLNPSLSMHAQPSTVEQTEGQQIVEHAIVCADTSQNAVDTDGSKQASMTGRISKPHGHPKSKLQQVLTQDEGESSLVKFVQGPFDMIIGACIVANTLSMCLQLQFEGYTAGVRLGLEDLHMAWPAAQILFPVLEHTFCIIFLAELGIKLYALRWRYFRDISNLLDFLLVSVTTLNQYVLPFFNLQDTGPNLSVARVIRVVRVVRAMRVVRAVRVFRQLRILVRTVGSSLMALFWSMVLLGLCMLVGAIFLCQLLAPVVRNPDEDMDLREWVWKHFGTTTTSLFTMFEITFSGCWPNYSTTLIWRVSVWYRLFFIVYVSLVVFAMIRIITALFLKETLQAAANDADFMISEKLKERNTYMAKLREVFRAVDDDDDGEVTMEQFKQVIENQRVKTYLALLELDVHDADMLYALLDDGDGRLTYEEFLQGVSRLKGQARSFDVVSILHACNRIETALGLR